MINSIGRLSGPNAFPLALAISRSSTSSSDGKDKGSDSGSNQAVPSASEQGEVEDKASKNILS